jgi:hypothetical protein
MLFSVGYTLPYDCSGSYLASHKSKIFLAMWGTAAAIQTPKQKGAYPPSGNPLIYILARGPLRKIGHVLINISQPKTCVWGPKRTFFTI